MAKVANEPAICVSAPRCYIQRIEQRMEPPFHSGFVGRATATPGKRSPMNARNLRTALGAMLITLTSSCTECIQVRGTGSSIANRMHTALVDETPLVSDYSYSAIREVTRQGAATGFADALDPAHGKFAFEVRPDGKFTGWRCINITITPWDEEADREREIVIDVWHWNIFPPFTRGPDSEVLQLVAQRLRERLKVSGAPNSPSMVSQSVTRR